MGISSFFYERRILSEIIIELNNHNLICDDIGIYTFSKYHNFEFNHISLTNKVNWKELISQTLNFTLLTLILKKIIVVEVVKTEDSYLFGTHKIKKRGFLMSRINKEFTDDILSNDLLSVLDSLICNSDNQIYLHEVICRLFDKYLGEQERFLKPSKQFLLKILNQYVDKNDWLKFKEDYSLIGTNFKYKVEIEPIYIPRLKMQHDNLEKLHKELLLINVPYRQMSRRISEVSNFNIKMRDLLFNSGNRRYNSKINFLIPSTNY